MTSLAVTYGFTADQGATFERVLTWTNPDGTAIDLAGYTARMKIRRRTTSQDVVETLTTESGNITLGGAAGTITISLSDTETAALPAEKLQYDLELISSLGEVTRLIMGYFVVRSEMTR
ncbi:MAG: hypothetical protein ACO395_06430 [Pontimonas sp.]